jgi:hypothetical protein
MNKLQSVVALIAFVIVPVTANAQTPNVKNPSAVEFIASPDHTALQSYEMDILRPDGTVLQTISLGKPVPAATTNLITASLNVQPIAFGVGYSVRVRAVAAGPSVSEWTNSLNKFDRAPGPPSNAVVK